MPTASASPDRVKRSPKKFFRSPGRKSRVDTAPQDTATIKFDSEFPIEEKIAKPGRSLGSGSLSPDGSVTFRESPSKMSPSLENTGFGRSLASPAELETVESKLLETRVFLRNCSSFLRVADLEMDETSHSTASDEIESPYPNYHHASVDPPPGIDHDPKERWVALNDGDGSHAPIAPVAVKLLSNFGLCVTLDSSMWTPDSKTDKIFRRATAPDWLQQTFQPGRVRLPPKGTTAEDRDVLIWSGTFRHGGYGSDLPAIRAAGVVDMPAQALMELLVDSSRVKEYNKLSLGRQDLVTFQDNMNHKGPFGHSITKVMKSETKPPMVRKTLAFISLLHSQELEDGSGYLIVTRAVHHPDSSIASNVLLSEILIGVNLIRKVEGDEDRCLMINVNHVRSPMVPLMVAKRIGVSGAASFINDIRALAEK